MEHVEAIFFSENYDLSLRQMKVSSEALANAPH